MTANGRGRSYSDPYVSGVGLGLVLLGCFVLLGRGLGASGAFTRVAASAASTLAPEAASASPVFARYDPGLAQQWILFEVAGVILGGYVSARLAGRARIEVERGPTTSPLGRLTAAFLGGAAMGTGAVLARGCTSGLALTGGAMLSVGAWIFMLAAFASAYAVTPLIRRLWR